MMGQGRPSPKQRPKTRKTRSERSPCAKPVHHPLHRQKEVRIRPFERMAVFVCAVGLLAVPLHFVAKVGRGRSALRHRHWSNKHKRMAAERINAPLPSVFQLRCHVESRLNRSSWLVQDGIVGGRHRVGDQDRCGGWQNGMRFFLASQRL